MSSESDRSRRARRDASRRAAKKTRAYSRSRESRFESLEQRALLTINAPVIAGNELVITGSAQDDTVVVAAVANNLQVTITSSAQTLTYSFAQAGINGILFRGDNGNDSFRNDTAVRALAYGDGGNDILSAGTAGDILHGGIGDDTLQGGAGIDTLHGEDGNDTLRGGSSDDVLYGHEGDDRLFGDAGSDQLFGGNGHDTIDGGTQNDFVSGGDGNDILTGGDGNDQIYGESGDDQLYGTLGDDRLDGSIGNDWLDGGAGADSLYGGDGADNLIGDTGADQLFGDAGNDVLSGGLDNDWLEGNGGNDTLAGDAGNDQLLGSDGNDSLNGGDGDDILQGLVGVDTLLGGNGNDTLYGGDDADLLRSGAGIDLLYGGNGDDSIWIEGTSGTAYGDAGNDTIIGSIGADVVRGGDGDDQLDGGGGNDQLYGEVGDDRLSGSTGNDFLDGGVGVDFVRGGLGNDELYGGDGNDLLYGDDGNDRIYGNADNDIISGGIGDDIAYGGTGRDRLTGNDGVDQLYGEDGNDLIDGGNDADVLDGGMGDDTLLGGNGADQLFGSLGNDIIAGGNDNDLLFGASGDDLLQGDSGADTLMGSDGNDELRGGDGNDRLEGELGNDRLFGGNGDDYLYGQAGNDAMLGDSGDDFLYASDGNDLLAGGAGSDWVQGDNGDDIIVGGMLRPDINRKHLDAIMAAWTSTDAYDLRVARLVEERFIARLQVEETVFDDGVRDNLWGSAGQDWFLVTGSNGIYNPLGDMGGENPDHGDEHDHGTVSTTMPTVEGFALLDALDSMRDRVTTEQYQSVLGHLDEPSMLNEHLGIMQLVRYQDVTHMAMHDGAWSDPHIWADGVVPAAGARVLIPVGVNVQVDRVLAAPVFTIRVDGVLSFATNVSTQLRVDTLVVSPVGKLEIGTAANPIAAGVTAQLTFTDTGAIDRDWDPYGISRGLISHGAVEMVGVAKNEYAPLLIPPMAGTTLLSLAETATGWQVGDQIVIPGVVAGQDETRTVLAVVGNLVTVAPLAYSHLPPSSELQIQVANLTRNIVVSSQGSAANRLGHTMFMHSRNVHISNASFMNLGRSDKSQVVNDSVVDANWNLVAGTGTNPRARYAVHFHRNGTGANGEVASVDGSVVIGGPSWGFVNHSSNVSITDNIAYQSFGSAFVAEAGDEIGLFQGNFAIGTRGTGADSDTRDFFQDFGFSGEGFWFQSAGVRVINNISAGNVAAGFMYYTRGLTFGGRTVAFAAANLVDQSLANGAATIRVDDVPIREFTGNVAYASGTGLEVRYNQRLATHGATSTLSNSTFWNNRVGIDMSYAANTILRNMSVRNYTGTYPEFGVTGNSVTRSITYDNLTVTGYVRGINMPRRGVSAVNGGTYSNYYNIVVQPGVENNRQVSVNGTINFIALSPLIVPLASQFDVVADFITFPETGDYTGYLFNSSHTYLNYNGISNRELFFWQQRADVVPFPAPVVGIPSQYIGRTSLELWNFYGVAISGQLAPSSVFTLLRVGGLLI